MELFSGSLFFAPFYLLFMFHVFIRPKLSLVWTLSYIFSSVLLVLVLSVVIFSIYRFQTVVPRLSVLPYVIILCVLGLLFSVHVDLSGYYWREICLILIVAFCVFQYINSYIERLLRWISRDCRLLDALCNDIRIVRNDTRRQISTLSSEMISLPLTELPIENLEQLVEQTTGVVDRAKRLIEDFPPRTQHFLSRQRLVLHLKRVVSISNDISRLRKDPCVQGIYGTLENYWSRIQSLGDMVIEDGSGSASPGPLENLVTTIIGEVTENLSQDGKKKIGLKLVLLEAFLNDLQQVKLKCTIEKVWLEEMKIFLDDILLAFETFRQGNKRLGLHRLHRQKSLDGEVGWMADGLTELLKAKEELGFKFTIIQPQTHPDQNNVNNEDLILSVVNKIRAHRLDQRTISCKKERADIWEEILSTVLAQEEAEAEAARGPDITSLCERLEKMYRHLKAIDSASIFRSVCLEHLNNVGSMLDRAFQKYIEEMHPGKLDTSRMESPIKDLEIFIKAHNYKVRQKYSSIIGLEEDTGDLIKLMDTADIEQFRIFTITGMQGIGKSTLAKEVYHQISQHFQFHKWVEVPINSINNVALLSNVGNQISTAMASQVQREGEIRAHYSQRIRDFLQQQGKYLLVLDNVPTMQVWDVLREMFPEEGNGSRILLATRDTALASHLDHHKKPHQLRLRTKEESWEIFLEKSQLSVEILSQDEMLKRAKQYVEGFWGLPSLISLVATLTYRVVHTPVEDSADTATLASSGENTVDSLSWSRVFTEVNPREQNLWSEDSHISGLPDNLRSLVYYFALFPKNDEIPTRRLFALWAAEGLVQKSAEETDSSEDIAKDCLTELIRLDIIQPMEISVHGKVRTCRFPGPLYDVGLGTITPSDQQRLVDHCSPNDEPTFRLIHGVEHSPDEWRRCVNLISVISFDRRKGDKPGKDIGNFLRKGIANGCFKKLKVLDLERVFRPQLPETIGKLTELRYLGLRWTHLENIPSTIGNLSNLQTLDLKHTFIRTLPDTLWKLQQLRHLYLNQTCRSKFVHQFKEKSLDQLQTLRGVFLDEKSTLKDRLDELTNLQKLGLAFQLSLEQQIGLAKRIVHLKHLQTLWLKSVGVMSEPRDLYLGNFSELKCLSKMYLFGKLCNALSSSEFPHALSNLTLSSSELESDPMQILGKLPHLKSLCLFSDSFKGNRMASHRGEFSQLLVLKLWNLDCLTDWIIEEGTMQNLKELEIRCCPKLNVPHGLMHLKILRQLKLRNMSSEFSKKCSAFVPLSIIDTKTLPKKD